VIGIFDDTTAVSSALRQGTLKITEQMSSRKPTASFSLVDQEIEQGKPVYVYDALELAKDSASGTDVLYVEDTYQDAGKWAAGDEIVVNARTANEKKHVVASVDHAARTVTLTTNLTANVIRATSVCGRLIFAGVCQSRPDEEVGMSGKLEYKVRLVDWSNLYDRKTVAQQFENMYPREIIGRIVYFFCATDSSATLETLDAAWTESGVAGAMADDTADRIIGSASQTTTTTGAGAAKWTKTITSQDLTAYDNIRFWYKVKAGEGECITSMKIRAGTDASNYFEWNVPNVGSAFEDCWNYESVVLSEYDSSAGSPDISTIAWLQLEVVCGGAITELNFDNVTATTGSFTLQGTARGDVKFPDVRVPYMKPSAITEDIAKKSSLFWYIDYERDIYLFSATTTPAPWSITDSSENYSDLHVDPDISKLKNRQIVIGGEAPDDSLYTQTFSADGSQTSFTLDYKPDTLTMTVAGVPQTIGVEGFVLESAVDWIWNFQEKVIRKTATGSTPTAGQAVVFTYYPYKPIRVSVTSPTSIAAMKVLTGGDGIYDGEPISDASLASYDDARIRGRGELSQYANAITTATFRTRTDGLRAGQSIPIADASRGVNDSFLIQSVRISQIHGSRFSYEITASSSLFGLIELIQMLLRRSSKFSINPTELVDTILNDDEIITLTPAIALTAKNKTVNATLRVKKVFDFVGLSGSISADGKIDSGRQWYAVFTGGETGTAQFATSRHNNNAELRLTTAVGGDGKDLTVKSIIRIAAAPSVLYTAAAWTEVQAALTSVGTGGGFKLVVKEWAAIEGGSALATNTVFSGVTAAHDFTKRSSMFTTNASTAWISLEISLYRAAGTARLTDVILTPATTETATLPAIASFSQAT